MLGIFHNDLLLGDEIMDKGARQVEAMRPGTIVARKSITL